MKNHGEVQQYYVEESHPAIIPPEQFALVQEMMAERTNSRNHSGVTVFSGKIFCGSCGGLFGSKVWHSTDKYRRVVWQCGAKYRGAKKCTTPHLTEEQIREAFIRAMNSLSGDSEFCLTELRAIAESLTDTPAQDEERIGRTGARRERIDRFIQAVKEREGLIAWFDPGMWAALVDQVTVEEDGRLVFRTTGGAEIDVRQPVG